MKLHHTKKTKYMKLVNAGLTATELRSQMIIDGEDPAAVDEFLVTAYPGYEPTYVTEEVAAATLATPATPPPPPPAPEQQPTPPPPPPDVKAPKYDADNMVGESFKQYNDHLKSLPLNQLQDFEVFKVEPVIVERYPGMDNSPKDLIGVKKTLDRVIKRTRIAPKTAMELNAQVRNTRQFYVLA